MFATLKYEIRWTFFFLSIYENQKLGRVSSGYYNFLAFIEILLSFMKCGNQVLDTIVVKFG